MHPIAGTAAAVVLLLPLIYVYDRSHHTSCECSVPAPLVPCAMAPLVPGATATGRVSDPGVFAAQPGAMALQVTGDVSVARGTLTIEDGDIMLGGYSLRNVLAAVVAQGRASCGGIPCVRGVHDFLRTCQCICEAGWSGAACDTFDCFGRGTWNPALQRCDCDAPYERSTRCEYRLCRGVMATSCEPLLSTGCDEDGVFPADNCTERCAAPGGCAFRLNWGRSRAPTADYRVGLCGAAFSADGMFVSFGAMQCASNLSAAECAAVFEREAPICCLYGDNCGRAVCSSASCCAQRRERIACLDAGCAWASNRVCADPRLVNTSSDCELPPRFNVTGAWSTNVVGCSGGSEAFAVASAASAAAAEAAAACPATARDRFAATVNEVCGAQVTPECRTALRAELDSLAWPELVAGPLPSLTPFRMDMLLANGSDSGSSLGACRNRLCVAARRDALAFIFVPGSPARRLGSEWQEEHASGFLVVKARGQISCIASSELSELLQIQLYSADGIYLVPTAATQPDCGVFVLPMDGIMFDEEGERVVAQNAAGNLVWGDVLNVVRLQITPL